MNPQMTIIREDWSPIVSLDGYYFPAGQHDRQMGLTDEYADIVATVEEPDGPYLTGDEVPLTVDEIYRAEWLLLSARQQAWNEQQAERAIEHWEARR